MMENVTSKPIGVGGAQGPNDEQAKALSAASPKPVKPLEIVTFEGTGSILVPIKKVTEYMEGGKLKTKEVPEKVPVDFPEADNRRAQVSNPDVIAYLRVKRYTEVAEEVLEEEMEQYKRDNRSSKPSFGAMEQYVDNTVAALSKSIENRVSDLLDLNTPKTLDTSNLATRDMVAGLHETIDKLTEGLEAVVTALGALKTEISTVKGRVTKVENAVKVEK